LTLGTNGVVRGRGNVGNQVFLSGTNGLINNGRITADIAGGSIVLSATNLTNNGTLSAANGGTMSLGTFTNGTGRFRASSGGRMLLNQLSGNLNDSAADGLGSLIRINSGTLLSYTINQPIAVTNRATLNLQGNWTRSADIYASGRIIFDYPTAGPSVYAATRAAIISGFNSGAWNGSGIFSTAAAANNATAVGYAEASNALTATGGSFSGETVDGTAVLVRWTYKGDANVDGVVDVSDLGRLATNWQTAADWSGGDFNYDHFVDVSDLGALATNWQLGVGNPLGKGSFEEAMAAVGLGGVSVPEPASFGVATALLSLCCAGRSRRRTRSRSNLR